MKVKIGLSYNFIGTTRSCIASINNFKSNQQEKRRSTIPFLDWSVSVGYEIHSGLPEYCGIYLPGAEMLYDANVSKFVSFK